MLRQTLSTFLAALAMTAGLTLAAATPAAALSCPSGATNYLDGATTRYDLTCEQEWLRIKGWVKDTRADGKCAVTTLYVKGHDPERFEACGKGVTETYDFYFWGTDTVTDIALDLV